MRILYKFPTRSRPSKLFAALDNIQQLSTHDNYQIAITADIDDKSMMNPEVRDNINTYRNVDLLYGTSLSKVDAINRDLVFYDSWDILINMSDDMQFIAPGFDSIIVNAFQLHGLDCLMHFPDQAAGPALITMAIMGRTYFDRDGYIYNPEYKSLFCDNEQQAVAKLRGRYVYKKTRLFNHLHPAWGHGTPDALLKHTESFHMEDKATFERRKSINFGI